MPRGRFAPEIVGRTFGRLRVLSRAGTTTDRLSLWRCLCDPDLGGCGAVVPAVRAKDLRDGTKKSCGCLQREAVAAATRSARGRRHLRRLHSAVWPKVCPTCGTGFLGTARQKYHRPECRPRKRR
jgi:hypothetical protein